MLVDQTGLVDDIVIAAVPFLEGQSLIEREARFTSDIIDGAGQQIRFQGRGLLDRADLDLVEGRGGATPLRVPAQHDM